MSGGMGGGLAGGMGGANQGAMLQQSFGPTAPSTDVFAKGNAAAAGMGGAAPANPSNEVFTGGNQQFNNQYTASVGNAMGSSDLFVKVCKGHDHVRMASCHFCYRCSKPCQKGLSPQDRPSRAAHNDSCSSHCWHGQQAMMRPAHAPGPKHIHQLSTISGPAAYLVRVRGVRLHLPPTSCLLLLLSCMSANFHHSPHR